MESEVLLRENAEIWYAFTNEEIKEFEDLDLAVLRKIMHVPFSTPSESFFLELGIFPIKVVIKARRANYLHYILNRNEDEMLYNFFMT